MPFWAHQRTYDMDFSENRMNKTIVYCLCVLSLLFSDFCLSGEIYKWTDAKGKTHFSDKKPLDLPVEEVNPEINTMQSTQVKSVVMYATSWCGYCAKARSFFKKQGIAFTEYDIEKDADAKQRYDALGGQGIPVIFIDDVRINGFNESRVKRLLN